MLAVHQTGIPRRMARGHAEAEMSTFEGRYGGKHVRISKGRPQRDELRVACVC
jgi:hypothetical protein